MHLLPHVNVKALAAGVFPMKLDTQYGFIWSSLVKGYRHTIHATRSTGGRPGPDTGPAKIIDKQA